jgi:predicted small secreted protein
MKRTIVIVALVIFACATITSCAASRGARGGCKGTAGYVGYGSR